MNAAEPLSPTDKLRKVLAHTYEGCKHLGAGLVGTDHLLLGILRHRSNVACDVLSAFGISIDEVEKRLVRSLDRGSETTVPQFTPVAERALADAERGAQSRGAECVGTDDLLCALLLQPQSISARLLRDLGLSRELLERRLSRRSTPREEQLDGAVPAAVAFVRAVRLEGGAEQLLEPLVAALSGLALEAGESGDTAHAARLRGAAARLAGCMRRVRDAGDPDTPSDQ